MRLASLWGRAVALLAYPVIHFGAGQAHYGAQIGSLLLVRGQMLREKAKLSLVVTIRLVESAGFTILLSYPRRGVGAKMKTQDSSKQCKVINTSQQTLIR